MRTSPRPPRQFRASRLVAYFALAAVLGVAVFGRMAWRSVTIEHAEAPEALSRVVEARNQFAGASPILQLDLEGRVVRRPPPEGSPQQSHHLRVLAYWSSEQRLVEARVPFWFWNVKGPAVELALRGTGLDLERLGITAADLQRYGPSLVFDETRTGGDRLLVWTE